MKKYEGIKHIKDETYEVNFRPFRGARRVFKRITAGSKQEASAKRSELITEARKIKEPEVNQRGALVFAEIWPALERNLLADNLPLKTRLRYEKTYNRLFHDFRLKRFSYITTPDQLSLPFFEEYKGYYGNELNHPKGLRAEFIYVKALMRRLRKLGYCTVDIINDLKDVRVPQATKKDYPEIAKTKMKEFLVKIKNERPDIYGPVYFMLRTGRRVEETTLIERKDIVWEGIKPIKINIRAETTKMKTAAPLNFLDSDLQAHLRRSYQKNNKHKSTYLFLNQRKKKFDQGMITRYLGTLSEEMLKVRITSHFFRHFFATECGKANLPIIDVMAISGIKDVNILTKYYSHSTNEGQAKVLESTRLL
jgi:hypothetical protein